MSVFLSSPCFFASRASSSRVLSSSRIARAKFGRIRLPLLDALLQHGVELRCGNSALPVDAGAAAPPWGLRFVPGRRPWRGTRASTATRIGFLVIAYILSSGRKFVQGVGANRKRMHRMRDQGRPRDPAPRDAARAA